MVPSNLGYSLREAGHHFKRNFSTVLGAVVTIFLSLFIIGLFVLASVVLDNVVGSVEDRVTIQAFLSDDADQSAVDALQAKVEGWDNVESVTYKSKEEALEEYKNTMSNRNASDAVAALDGQNPIPASLVIKLSDPQQVESTATKLATPRKIELTGNVTGSADFDGSKDIQIATSLPDVYLPLAGGEVTGTVNFKGGATGNWTGTVRGGNMAFEDKILKQFDSKKDQSLDFIFNCNIHNYPVYLVSVGTMFYRNTGSSQRFINFGVAALYPDGWDINWLYSKENHNFIDYVGSTYAITVKAKAPLTINVSWKAQSQDSSTVFATSSVWVKSIGE